MYILPRLIGPGRTLDFLWSHRTIGAQEAWQIGLVDRLIEDAIWEEELDRFTDRMRHLPQPAVQLTKLGIQQAANLDLTSMLSLEWESQKQCWVSLETAEGLLARQEGRDPRLGVKVSEEED
jgi:enoyl-CoA hydratase/carnithine racemase